MGVTGKTSVDEAEWQAQERALHAAHECHADGRDVSYRFIAKTVRSMSRNEPPADFAADVVKHVASQEAGFERPLSQLLLAVFLVASVAVAVVCGGQLWQTPPQGFVDGASGWALAAAGCASLSWLGSRLLGLAVHADGRMHST